MLGILQQSYWTPPKHCLIGASLSEPDSSVYYTEFHNGVHVHHPRMIGIELFGWTTTVISSFFLEDLLARVAKKVHQAKQTWTGHVELKPELMKHLNREGKGYQVEENRTGHVELKSEQKKPLSKWTRG